MDNMTALISCFARAYHFKNNEEWIFRDEMAGKLLSENEYSSISENMVRGIKYFNPNFEGNEGEALRYIVDKQLSPSVLVRSAFCERALKNEINLGCSQYVILGSGFDTYALRTKDSEMNVFEIDLPEMIEDKNRRIETAGLKNGCSIEYVSANLSENDWSRELISCGLDKSRKSFGSLLGLSYYLKKEEFSNIISELGLVFSEGSGICFDYPEEKEGTEAAKNRELAEAAGEKMQAKYNYCEMEDILQKNGFLIYEHLDKELADIQLFGGYNIKYPERRLQAPEGINYCLAIRK